MTGLRSPLAVAAQIAARQHGTVARRQVAAGGLTDSAIEHLLAAGELLHLYRGVYAVGHRPVAVRSREMAVALMAGVRAVSRQSALAIWAMTRPRHGPVHATGVKPRTGDGLVITARAASRPVHHAHAGAGSTSPLTSAGSPRSGNGTSIASKSRGTTVLGNTARASSRISRGK